jgi:chitodextrinase
MLGLLALSLSALPARAQTVSCTGVPAWVSTTTYSLGNRVTYQGGLHEFISSTPLANVPPTHCEGAPPAGCGWWRLVGTCGTPSGDTTAPSVPTGLTSPSRTSNSVSLSWNASTDNSGGSGVAGYDVFRDGANVGSPSGTSFTVTGLAANTTFSFRVRARDNAGNASAQSAALSVTTNPSGGNCTTLPSVPGSLVSTGKSSSSVSLSWNASNPGANCTVTYDIFQNGAQVRTGVAATNATISGLAASTTFSFRVRAVNQFGASAQGNTISVTTDPVSTGGLRFCPYIDVSPGAASPIMNLANNGSGVRCYTLAFILGRGCTPAWFGVFEINSAEGNAIGQRIQELKNAGGNVIISFGGAAAPELANACTDVNQLRAAYQAVINKYHPMAIDLDIEEFTANDRRNQALAGVTGAPIHYTLGVSESGMTQVQLDVLSNARARGVNVSMVNIMTMDYGHPVSDMYAAAISAARGASTQMNNLGFGSAALVFTPMFGQNDSGGEIFTLANAQSLRNNAAGASMLAFWSMGRDNGGCPGRTSADATCSGVSQSTWGFTNIMKSF